MGGQGVGILLGENIRKVVVVGGEVGGYEDRRSRGRRRGGVGR